MKLSLKKGSIEKLRFIGFDHEFSELGDLGKQVADLNSIIHSINHLQVIDKKIYFELTENGTFIGPCLPVIGNIPSQAEFKVIDLVKLDYYKSVISDNDALVLGQKSFYEQLNRLIHSVKGKISFKFAYLSIELAKIELHLFAK